MDRYLPPLSPTAVRWVRFLALLVALALLGWLVVDLRPVLTPILVALAIAYMCNPLVSRLQRWGVSRLQSTVGLYAIGLCVLLVLGFYLTVKTIEQVYELRANVGGYVNAVRMWLAAHNAATQPAGATQPATLPQLAWWREFGPVLEQHGVAWANSVLEALIGVFSSLLNWVSIFILIPLYTFFFLWRFDDLVRTVRDHLPAKSRAGTIHVVTIIDRAIAGFFRGRLLVCLVVGLVAAIGWTLVGVPYSLPLGAMAGLLNLVPFLSLLVLPPALVSSYFGACHAGEDWKIPVLLAAGVYFAVQALESFIITPYVLSKSSGLHPITTVVALMIGANCAGLAGMLLAIPIASTLKVLGAEFVLPELRRLATQPPSPDESTKTPGAPPPEDRIPPP
jgi:predicted PurR-regulated permease PerM